MKSAFFIKVFPGLILGGGLFFVGCGLQPPVEAPSAMSIQAEEDYRIGMDYLKEGLHERAIEAFSRSIERDADGETAPEAMHRIAEISHMKGEDGAALDWLEKIESKFPEYGQTAAVRLLKVEVFASLGERARALAEGESWAEANRDHALYPKMCDFLGELSLQEEDGAAAFRWWIEAYEESGENSALRTSSRKRLDELVETLDAGQLASVAYFSTGTPFAARVFYRMSESYLSRGEIEKAREAADALIRAAADREWISRGEKILEKVRRELSVKSSVVGCILPQSGPFALYGRELLRGIQLGLAMEPERPGNGIEVVIEDSGGDPGKAGDVFTRLVEKEKVVGVIGPLSSNVAEEVGEKAEVLEVPLIAITQKEKVPRIGKQVFRNFIFPSQEVDRLLDGAMGDLDIMRFAVLYPENAYGRLLMELFREAVFERGGEVTDSAVYEPGTTDFTGPIKEIIGLDSPRPSSVEQDLRAQWPAEREEMEAYPDEPQPVVDFDAVFIPDSPESVAMLAPQILYHDVSGLWLLGTSAWQSPQLLDQASDYTQGAMFTAGFFDESSRPGVASFVEAYRRRYGAAPGILAATGFDTIRLLSLLLHEREIRTRIDLRLALEDCPPFTGVTGDISFDGTGEVEKEPFLLTVHGSEFIEF